MIIPLCAFPPRIHCDKPDCVSRITWALDGALSRHMFLRIKRIDLVASTTYVWKPQHPNETPGMLARMSAVQVWEEVEMQTI